MTLYNEITKLLLSNIHLEVILLNVSIISGFRVPKFRLLMVNATSRYFLFGLLTLFDLLSVLFS